MVSLSHELKDQGSDMLGNGMDNLVGQQTPMNMSTADLRRQTSRSTSVLPQIPAGDRDEGSVFAWYCSTLHIHP